MTDANTLTEVQNDTLVHPRVVVAGLWTAMMFVFAYVDLFSFFRADVVQDALDGRAEAFTVGQGFLIFTTLYIVPASLMIYLVLVLPSRLNRWLNAGLAALYALTIVYSCLDETWIYYFIGSGIELVLLLIILLRALRTL